jgi:hypothetical protein
MPTLSGQTVLPGVYSQQAQSNTPLLPSGTRIPAIIGTVIPTLSVSGETVTRGATEFDSVAHPPALSLGATITDANQVIYHNGTDYQLGTGGNAGKIQWLTGAASLTGTTVPPYTPTDLSGLTLIFTVGSGSPTTVTFDPSTTSISTVVTKINTIYGDTIASNSSSHLELSTGTLGTPILQNSSITIGNGTANSALGFVGGSASFTPQDPTTGVTYSVSYTYAKPTSAYGPVLAFSMSDVYNYAGPLAVDSGNNPLYTLTVAAQIAFANGAPAIYLQGLNAGDGAVLTQFQNALNKLQAVGCNIVVPVTGGNVATPISPATAVEIWSATQAHVDFMSSTTERKERTGYVGTYATDVPTNITQATALDDKRMLFVYNNQPTYFVGSATTASTLDGSYLAAAISGIRTSLQFDVATPLTHKLVTGFASIPDILLVNQKTQLIANGVCVIGTVSGSSLVLEGTTTNVSTVDNSEISVVEAADYVIQSCRTILEAIFIGQKILPNTPSLVATTTTAILSQLTTQQIINGLSGSVSAVVDGGNPSQIDVSFTYNAVYSLELIFITFGLAL